MQLNTKNLINLPVITQNGQPLGKISDFVIEADSQQIIKYYVKSNQLIKNILKGELIIHRDQVISLDNQKMVVENNIAKEEERAFVKAEISQKEAVAVSASEIVGK